MYLVRARVCRTCKRGVSAPRTGEDAGKPNRTTLRRARIALKLVRVHYGHRIYSSALAYCADQQTRRSETRTQLSRPWPPSQSSLSLEVRCSTHASTHCKLFVGNNGRYDYLVVPSNFVFLQADLQA